MTILDSVLDIKTAIKTFRANYNLKNKIQKLKVKINKLRLNPLREREEVQAIKKKIENLKARLK